MWATILFLLAMDSSASVCKEPNLSGNDLQVVRDFVDDKGKPPEDPDALARALSTLPSKEGITWKGVVKEDSYLEKIRSRFEKGVAFTPEDFAWVTSSQTYALQHAVVPKENSWGFLFKIHGKSAKCIQGWQEDWQGNMHDKLVFNRNTSFKIINIKRGAVRVGSASGDIVFYYTVVLEEIQN